MCDVIIRDVLRNLATHTDATMRQRHMIVRYIALKRTTYKLRLTAPKRDYRTTPQRMWD
jgi:hypothetical protein